MEPHKWQGTGGQLAGGVCISKKGTGTCSRFLRKPGARGWVPGLLEGGCVDPQDSLWFTGESGLEPRTVLFREGE